MSLQYDRKGRVTVIETLLRYVPGALFTIRNLLGIDPDGEGVPDATTTVKGKDRLATVPEAVAGVNTTTIVTPAGLAAALAAFSPPLAATTRLRIQFAPNGAGATLSVLLNETAVDDGDFVAGYTSTGIYTITAASPIFDGQAMVWGGGVVYGGSDYGFEVWKHSTTVIRVYVFNQTTAALTDVAGFTIPVLADIYA